MPDTSPIQLHAGGPMMWVFVGLAVVLIVLLLERFLYLRRGQIRAAAFLGGIKNILNKRRLLEAVAVCDETPGPVAAVVKAALREAHADEVRLRLAVQEAAINQLPLLERRLGAIAAIAQVAPLLGLAGTVAGMAMTFHAFMSGGEYATAKALAGGMWQALMVTLAGLALGVPSHLAHAYLSSRVRDIVRDVEWAANDIMRYLLVDYRAEPADDPAAAPGTPGVSSPAVAPSVSPPVFPR